MALSGKTKKKIDEVNGRIKKQIKRGLNEILTNIRDDNLELYDYVADMVYSNDEALDDEIFRAFMAIAKAINLIQDSCMYKINNETYCTCDQLLNAGISLSEAVEYYATGGDDVEQNTNK